MATSRLQVSGMDCGECATKVRSALLTVEGVIDAQVDVMSGEATVEHADGAAIGDAARHAIRRAGYGVRGAEGADHDHDDADRWTLLATAMSVGLWLVGAAVRWQGAETVARALFAASILAGGHIVLRPAIASLRSLTLDMHVLMSIAVVGALGLGDWAEAGAVVALFAVAERLEAFSMDRARNAIRQLMDIGSPEVTLLRDGVPVRARVEEAEVGQIALVKPGERVPLDGEVVAGYAMIDEAPITGESLPVAKSVGDRVFAGTINGTTSFELRITASSGDTVLAQIAELMRQAQASRSVTERMVDRFARYYTPLIVALAALMVAVPVLLLGGEFGRWFYRSLVVLVIGCPCALVIATPVTVVAGLARAARLGIIIKGGVHLENLGRLQAVVFDKTGTLTLGSPEVTDIVPLDGNVSADELLHIAASVESRSEHMLARGIVAGAEARGLAPSAAKGFEAFPGVGAFAEVDGTRYYVGGPRLLEWLSIDTDDRVEAARGMGRSLVYVTSDDRLLGVIALSDAVRSDAPSAIEEIRALGVRSAWMLTGDSEAVAQSVASKVGIPSWRAGLLPAEKADALRELRNLGDAVAMVGDGINDAPALATATVGVAMGGTGTDVALEASDVTLMGGTLAQLPTAIRLGRSTRRLIAQNVAIALASKGVVFALAGAGIATLWLAVLADVGVSVVVILNGLRMLRAGGSR